MESLIWKGCFERELRVGEDIVVAISNDGGEPELHAGIVLELEEGYCLISYNGWVAENEYTREVAYSPTDYPTGVIKRVFKIFA